MMSYQQRKTSDDESLGKHAYLNGIPNNVYIIYACVCLTCLHMFTSGVFHSIFLLVFKTGVFVAVLHVCLGYQF